MKRVHFNKGGAAHPILCTGFQIFEKGDGEYTPDYSSGCQDGPGKVFGGDTIYEREQREKALSIHNSFFGRGRSNM